MTVPPIYLDLDIGMGGHFEGFGGCEGSASGPLDYNENDEDKYPKSNKVPSVASTDAFRDVIVGFCVRLRGCFGRI